ncbi:MAG: class I SAM-dependent methyltransferase [Sulfuricurvum sp.]
MTIAMRQIIDQNDEFEIASCEKKYYKKCQVYTPDNIIKKLWTMLHQDKEYYEKVLDLGAGDGRFAKFGNYGEYIGIEIDKDTTNIDLPNNASIRKQCAFSLKEKDFDLCIGNPPYVRHQELESSWKKKYASMISNKLDEEFTQSSNIFVYFLAQALLKTKKDGKVALIIPFEWATRPSSRSIRNYINRNEWSVHVYRFTDDVFSKVLTTASITIIDKSDKTNSWNYYEIDPLFNITKTMEPTGTEKKILPYNPREDGLYSQRGLSPGSQKVFCLTEEERKKHNLEIGIDVLPCLVSLKPLSKENKVLTKNLFQKLYVDKNQRCWLVNSQTFAISNNLKQYFDTIPYEDRNTWTCNNRDVWWKYHSVKAPTFLYASAFTEYGPKIVINRMNAISVNSAPGIYANSKVNLYKLLDYIKAYDFESRIVNHSGKLKRIEINQMNSVLQEYIKESQFQ